jgi:quercetin dioxygenase-like cupin family protein
MRLNDDLTRRAAVHAPRMDWTPSPVAGVDRRMLFRIGEEKARATSIVRYAANSHFHRHDHPGGEEILVLEGAFRDEQGVYPPGAYLRNPPGSSHAPGSDKGCLLLVKLWQFRKDDKQRIALRPGEGRCEREADGATSFVLYENPSEQVRIMTWPANAAMEMANPDGLELLVLAGSFREADETFERLSWLRLPAGLALRARAGADGARLWLKAGPLLPPNICDF